MRQWTQRLHNSHQRINEPPCCFSYFPIQDRITSLQNNFHLTSAVFKTGSPCSTPGEELISRNCALKARKGQARDINPKTADFRLLLRYVHFIFLTCGRNDKTPSVSSHYRFWAKSEPRDEIWLKSFQSQQMENCAKAGLSPTAGKTYEIFPAVRRRKTERSVRLIR